MIIQVDGLHASINKKPILDDVTLRIPRGSICSVIGPNGSGKTTLIRCLSRNLKASSGRICFEGEDISRMGTKSLARQQAVLSQNHSVFAGVTVRELVGYGRYAHSSWWRGGRSDDREIIEYAMERTGVKAFEDRLIGSLSGGERQRAWLAMAIAQQPKVLLLDEPTTFLDICHQLDVLELVRDLNREENITIVMVLHDINQAVRFSSRILVMMDGALWGSYLPEEILSENILRDVFSVEAEILDGKDKPVIYPMRSL